MWLYRCWKKLQDGGEVGKLIGNKEKGWKVIWRWKSWKIIRRCRRRIKKMNMVEYGGQWTTPWFLNHIVWFFLKIKFPN